MEDIKLVTRQRAAELLSLSIRTIDNLLDAGTLPSVYIGASRRIALNDVNALAERGTK